MDDKTIIIVDDSGSLSNKLRGMLSTICHNVFTAENCYDLMDKIYKTKPNLLIFNTQVNWLHPLEFVIELRNMSKNTPDVIFIYENIETSAISKASCINITCVKYPFTMVEFITLVKGKLNI